MNLRQEKSKRGMAKFRVFTNLALAVVAMSAVAATSCVRDNVDERSRPKVPYGNPVTIAFNPRLSKSVPARETRGYHNPGELNDGVALDARLTHARILIYNKRNGDLIFNQAYSEAELQASRMPIELDILTGEYDFVFIANADEAADDILADNTKVSVIGSLSTIVFDGASYNNTAVTPMVAVVRGVEVVGDNSLVLPDGTEIDHEVWETTINRTAIRLSFEIPLSISQVNRWNKQIKIAGAAKEVNLMSDRYDAERPDAVRTYTANAIAPGQSGAADGFISDVKDASDKTLSHIVYFDRIILPELMFTPESTKANALELSMDISGVKKGLITLPNPETSAEGYTIPRNTWVHLDVTVKDTELEVTPEVVPWNEVAMEDVEFDGVYFLHTDRNDMAWSAAGGPQTIKIATDYPAGWEVSSSGRPNWISASPVNGSAPVPDGVEVVVTAAPNTGAIRTGTFTMISRGGSLRKKITVVQLPPNFTDSPTPESVIPYVGAFWKHNQTGERLILMKRPTTGLPHTVDGKWSASVIEGMDWIVLDGNVSTDPGVWTDNPVKVGNDSGFDGRHPVLSESTWVGGELTPETPEGGIFFRIGLGSAVAPTTVRYGVILLSYTDNSSGVATTKYRRIFVRQGEADDYVMRPQDAGGSLTSRPKAVKYSPYNLTADKLNAPVRATLSATADTDAGADNPGRFTDYPTQAGAFFQWAQNEDSPVLRYAWDPFSASHTGITAPHTFTYWTGGTIPAVASNETCPEGYRRVNDGSTSGIVSNYSVSELRQSLFANPSTSAVSQAATNISAGYYADGFFDRMTLSGSNGSQQYGVDVSRNSVSVDNRNVAHVGWIHYNPTTNASLFFPSAGVYEDNGSLINAGATGLYQTSSSNHYNLLCNLKGKVNMAPVHADNVVVGYEYKSYALSIRCVVDNTPTDVTKPTEGVLAPPGVLGVSAETGTLTLRGSKEYANTSVATRADQLGSTEFGDLFPETVYLANFKWGSTIAITAKEQLDEYFNATDIVWVPDEYRPSLAGLLGNISNATDSSSGWALVPYANSTVSPHPNTWSSTNTSAELTAGLGDPCKLADNGVWTDHKIPTGNPWHGVAWSTTTMPPASAAGVDGRRGDVSGTDDWSMFLPFSYHRNADGESMLHNGYYWSNTSISNSYATLLLFTNNTVNNATSTTSRAIGAAIRCQNCVPVKSSDIDVTHDATGDVEMGTPVTLTADITGDVPAFGAKYVWLHRVMGGSNTWQEIGQGKSITFTPTEDGINIFRVTVSKCGGTAVNSSMETISVTSSLPQNPVYAPPGVLGIRESDIGKTSGFNLTLAGSSTYKNTVVATQGTDATVEFGAMENEPVYTVYFKRGSSVAIIGGNLNAFDKEDIVWVNSEYGGNSSLATALTAVRNYVDTGANAAAKFALVPKNTIDAPITETNVIHWKPETPANLSLGFGDPCYNAIGSNYAMASNTGGVWGSNLGFPFGKTSTNSTYTVTGIAFEDAPASSTFSGVISPDKSVYLPPAGQRSRDGIATQGDYGNWPSSSFYQTDTHIGIVSQVTNLSLSVRNSMDDALPVRCVDCTPITSVTVTHDQQTNTVDPGTEVVFDADVVAGNPLKAGRATYQWQISTDYGLTWTNAAGGGSRQYVNKVSRTMYMFRVGVTVCDGTPVYSAPVTFVLTPENAVYAPPGVLGIKKSDFGKTVSNFNLTLRGSSTYKNTVVATGADGVSTLEFGPMEDEPVYMVYFQRGSSVAIIGGETNVFDPDDAVWVNPEYTTVYSTESDPLMAVRDFLKQAAGNLAGTASGSTAAYGSVPHDLSIYSGAGYWTSDVARLPKGQADPCTYATGRSGKSYVMTSATSAAWGTNLGYPFTQGQTTSGTYNVTGMQFSSEAASSTFSGIISTDRSIYLPPAGTRTTNGVNVQGSTGEYMSYYMYDASTRTLKFTQGLTNPGAVYNNTAQAAPVRCVDPNQPAAPVPVTINGVTWAGSNLKAENVFESRIDGESSVFQWGSTRAFSSIGTLDATALADWRPNASSPTDATWPASVDPCPSGWHVPTRTEFQSLAGATVQRRVPADTAQPLEGYFYGSNATAVAAATLSNPNGCLYMPSCNWRNGNAGVAVGDNYSDYYWTSNYYWSFSDQDGLSAYGFSQSVRASESMIFDKSGAFALRIKSLQFERNT